MTFRAACQALLNRHGPPTIQPRFKHRYHHNVCEPFSHADRGSRPPRVAGRIRHIKPGYWLGDHVDLYPARPSFRPNLLRDTVLQIQNDLLTRECARDANLYFGLPIGIVQHFVPVIHAAAQIINDAVAAPAFFAGV